ncbi:MAG: O-antigen ligase family protein [Thermoanaerobaculia bacterium]
MTERKPRSFFVITLPILVFSAFLTEVRFIPSLANNVGLFEVLGALIIGLFFLSPDREALAGNSVIWIIGLCVVVASASLINVQTGMLVTGAIQVSILVFLFFFLFVSYNLFLSRQISPGYILRWITISAAIVGPWILRQGFLFTSNLEAVGPFRNRSHMGIYMLTTFWLVLVYTFWPSRARDKWTKIPVCLVALSLCLYAVAISGRRSVYLSLFIGLVGLVLVFTLVLQRRRATVAVVLAFAIGFLGLLYTKGQDFLPRSEFFQNRVGMIGSRLRSATDAVTGASQEGFMALQMQGITAALSSHPILGIGWGTFHEWSFNPSRHEVHSTPLKFLAETGVVGLAIYLALLYRIVFGAGRLAIRMRGSPYAGSYLVLAVAISSLSISYLYNRHLTERTFWLLLLVFLILEAFSFGYERSRLEAAPEGTRTSGIRRPGSGQLEAAAGHDRA